MLPRLLAVSLFGVALALPVSAGEEASPPAHKPPAHQPPATHDPGPAPQKPQRPRRLRGGPNANAGANANANAGAGAEAFASAAPVATAAPVANASASPTGIAAPSATLDFGGASFTGGGNSQNNVANRNDISVQNNDTNITIQPSVQMTIQQRGLENAAAIMTSSGISYVSPPALILIEDHEAVVLNPTENSEGGIAEPTIRRVKTKGKRRITKG
jgi:hypothetical protein